MRDAQYYIKKLAEKHGYRFVAVTSLSNDPSAQKLRTCNLNKLFGNGTFIEFHYLDCGADKDDILTDLAHKYRGSIWVEDKIVNAQVGAKLEYDSIIMEHGHNMNYDGSIKLVKNWEEIYKYAIAKG